MPWTRRALSWSLWALGKDQNSDYFPQWRNGLGWVGADLCPVPLEPGMEGAATTPQQLDSAVNNLGIVLTLPHI